MAIRIRLLLGGLAPMVVLGLGVPADQTRDAAVVLPTATDANAAWRPAVSLPVVRAHRYRMSGAIRPLLFWIGRERVGEGQIVWRERGDGTRAFELLIGSDPEFAPRQLNRWGYLAEELRGTEAHVIGLISSDADDTLEGVTADGVDQLPESAFKTIRARVGARASHAEVSTVGAATSLTYHDLDAVLELMRRQPTTSIEVRVAPRPSDARPGFLAAMSELLHTSVEGLTRSGRVPPALARQTIPYMYGDGLHDLTVRSLDVEAERTIGGRVYRQVIHGKFQTRSRATGDSKQFELIYGTRGGLAEVPIWIRYRPRWWLRADLSLEPAGEGQGSG